MPLNLFVSTHATRTGRDPPRCARNCESICFNSRDPHGSRLCITLQNSRFIEFQLTRPARVATAPAPIELSQSEVSTHATRTGRDHHRRPSHHHQPRFNSRDPHGSRHHARRIRGHMARFNSRDPHGSRPYNPLSKPCEQCFNSRDPHGSRRPKRWYEQTLHMFQLTRPARVATEETLTLIAEAKSFNSRDPHGSRRAEHRCNEQFREVSTHATRTGRDLFEVVAAETGRVSTHATRTGRDEPFGDFRGFGLVSTHATRTGRDPSSKKSTNLVTAFQLTRPARVATARRTHF